MPTYTRSRDFALSGYGEPRRKDILCCILVSVVLCLAACANPLAHVKRQSFDDVSTSGTCLAARKEAVDFDQLPAVPCALVRKKGQEHAPSCVRDHSGEAVVADHPGDVQILDYDHLVFANESSAKFLQLVAATVGHLDVEPSELDSSLVPVVTSFLLSTDGTRESALTTQFSGVVFAVNDLLSGRERGQCIDTKIDANGGLELWQSEYSLVLAEQRHVPALGSIKRYRRAGWLDAFGQRPTPTDVEWGVHLGQSQFVISEAEPTASELGRTTGALLLEAWVLRALGEEVGVSCLQVAQGLLKRHARYLVQKGKLRILLPDGERSTLRGIAHRFFARCPRFGAFIQGAIVDEATTSDGSAKQSLLLGSRVKAVLETSQRHVYRIASTPVKATTMKGVQ